MIYDKLIRNRREKLFALLIDPDKYTESSLYEIAQVVNDHPVDFIFIGGSLVSGFPSDAIDILKSKTRIPVILFPGSLLQISPNADAILLLSLISGRNPEFLIGSHVVAAPLLKKSNLEILPTGYILIENGFVSSVEYMSNTKPIPAGKPEIAVATAITGEMLGLKLIYLEGGSGAKKPINELIIKEVKKNISIPLIVGGGIRTQEDMLRVYGAGADLIVVGNALENDLHRIHELCSARAQANL